MNEPIMRLLPETWLALDTSTSSMTIAIFRHDQPIAQSSSLSERNHSIRLIPAIKELLDSLGMAVSDLRGVCAGVGPGSYTGVRIGVTAAKTIAWAKNLPLVGVSSLETLAYGGFMAETKNTGASRAWVVPIMDARRGFAYTGLYGDNGTGWKCFGEDGVRHMGEWMGTIAELAKGNMPDGFFCGTAGECPAPPLDKVILVGDAAPFLPVAKPLMEAGLQVSVSTQALGAEFAGAIALRKWNNGETESPHRFCPNYTQLTEAEKKLLADRK